MNRTIKVETVEIPQKAQCYIHSVTAIKRYHYVMATEILSLHGAP